MARKATGKVMEDRVWVPQKNGTWYCFLRRRVWEDGKVKTLGRELLGKADERGGELRPTRPKRKKKEEGGGNETEGRPVEAKRLHTGLTDILEFIGSDSGIDEDVRKAVGDDAIADKIISLARFAVASDGDTWPGIESWMLTHPVPYEHPITEDVYLDLFREVGLDESAVEGFFALRIKREPDIVLLVAYDSSTETSETRNPEARVGMNKDRKGKPAIKLLVLYSLSSRRPLAYAKRPGNVPDVISVGNAMRQLQALTDRTIALVTDGGFSSEENFGTILHAHGQVLSRVKLSWKWVHDAADAALGKLLSPANCVSEDDEPCVHGVTVQITRDFPFKRAKGSKRKGLKAGDTDHFKRRVYLHIYYDWERRIRENGEFMRRLKEIKGHIEDGTPLDAAAQRLADSCLKVKRRRGGRVSVTLDGDAIDEACKYHGMYALVSSHIADAGEALRTYRHREWIEDYFERFKQDCDGKVTRTGGAENLSGRLFVQFVAMCYLEELHNRVRDMKAELGRENGDPRHDLKENLDAEKKLKTWLEKRSLHNILNWFDAHETFVVSSDIRRRKWGTETVKRDRMFLEKLGMEVPA